MSKATLALPQLSMTAAWTNMAASDFGSVLRYAEATLRHMPPDWSTDLQSSEVAPHLAMLLAVTGWGARARQEYAAASPLQHLSPAELRVWELLKGRMTLSEIADALFLSRETVKSHTVSIYRRLQVSSRREAQDLAESWG